MCEVSSKAPTSIWYTNKVKIRIGLGQAWLCKYLDSFLSCPQGKRVSWLVFSMDGFVWCNFAPWKCEVGHIETGNFIPRCSMYGLFTHTLYRWKMNTFNARGNVGKYYLHGASGIEFHHENQVLQTYNASWLLCQGWRLCMMWMWNFHQAGIGFLLSWILRWLDPSWIMDHQWY